MGLFNRSKKVPAGRPASAQAPAWQDTLPGELASGPVAVGSADDAPAEAFASVQESPSKAKVSRPVMAAIAVAAGLAMIGAWVVSRHRDVPAPTLPRVAQMPHATAPAKRILPARATSAVRSIAPVASSTLVAAISAAPIDQARQMFLTASQNAVHVASIQQVRPGLFVVAYVVGDKSGQAWVDLGQKVVFIGSAVSPDGGVLTPSSAIVAMGATQSGIAPDMPSSPSPGALVAGPGVLPPPAMAAILKDHNAGFWEGVPKAAPVWAFVDPDSKESLAFYQRVQLLLDSHKIRVFWIPVGVKDPQSMPRAAFILAQVGQAKTLKHNFDGFSMQQSAGDTPSNVITIGMRHRILLNNTLLTDLGRLATPTALLCEGGELTPLFGPQAIGQVEAAQQCPAEIMAQVAK